MPPLTTITHPRQLLVEGRDALVFFQALLSHLGIADIQVQNFGGGSELRGFLGALSRAPGFSTSVLSLGVVRDAEADPNGVFRSICGSLSAAGFSPPSGPLTASAGRPRVTVLILPDHTASGMLETLCLASISDDPAIPCVDTYFACLQTVVGVLPHNLAKARVHAFLASRARPDLLVGQAANAGYWNWEHAAFNHVKQYLRDL